MFKKILSVFCVFALASVFCVSASYAASGSAVIKACEGDVMVKAAGSDKWVPAKANAPLNSGDSIQTQSGTAEVVYPDKSVLKIKNNTTTTLSEIKDDKSGKLTRKVKIMMGDMWASITPGTPTKTEFETPSAVAAVKGTVVSFSVDKNGVTQILTQTGLVTLQIGEAMSIDLGGGKAVQVAVTADGANITGLQGQLTVNLVNGTSIKMEPNVTIAGPLNKNNLMIRTTAGTATVIGKDGKTTNVQQGKQLVISPSGTFGVPTTDPSQMSTRGSQSLGLQGQQQSTGKDLAPSNNGNPTVNTNGGNSGSNNQNVSPSRP